MDSKAARYETGKGGEKDSFVYLLSKGFVKPTKEQRNKICERFKKEKGIILNKRGFDVIRIEDIDTLDAQLPKILYEVKTCGEKRGKKVTVGFKGLGFTLTTAERQNSENLKDSYKFIFVNMSREQHVILNFEDFFDKKYARIYPTWSVFIVVDLKNK